MRWIAKFFCCVKPLVKVTKAFDFAVAMWAISRYLIWAVSLIRATYAFCVSEKFQGCRSENYVVSKLAKYDCDVIY